MPVMSTLWPACWALQKLALADRKRHIHRILTDDDGERPALRGNDVPFGDIGLADLAGNRGSDAGIAEVDLRRLKIGFVDENSTLRRLIGGERLIAGNRRTRPLGQQLFRALQLDLGEYLGGLALRQFTLGLLDGRLEKSFLDTVERRPFLDELALLERDVFEIPGDAGFHLDPLDRFDAPDKVECLGDGLAFGYNHSNGNSRRRPGRLRIRGR